MKQAPVLSLILILVIAFATLSFLTSYPISTSSATPSVYVGISFCGNTTAQAKLLIDKVKTYTNLLVLQSGPISKNETATTEISDYAVASGLNLIVYFGWLDPSYPWQLPWIINATQRYGSHFLGVYYYDEPGGNQLDYNWTEHFNNVSQQLLNTSNTRYANYYRNFSSGIQAYLNGSTPDYDTEAQAYITYMRHERDLTALRNNSITKITSDYALYWYDYLGGYDIVLTQFGSNSSVIQDIALTRGAANLQNKTWGAIITWKYDQPPYLDTGKEVYNQMQMAYQAGAKYIILFDYPQIEGNPYGVLTDEHFQALEKFWDALPKPSITTFPGLVQADAVLVLPKNYGSGMRSPEDRIWIWGSDEKSPQIWDISRKLISQYGLRLDIVYDDPAFPIDGKYSHVYYWNQTI